MKLLIHSQSNHSTDPVILAFFNFTSRRVKFKADSRFALSQWETSLHRNAVSQWLGPNLELALKLVCNTPHDVQGSPIPFLCYMYTGQYILYNQYLGCWWPGDARSQGISIHGIDIVILPYSNFTSKGVTWELWHTTWCIWRSALW